MNQIIISADQEYVELDNILRDNKISSLFLVCDDSLKFLNINNYFENLTSRLGIKVVKFSEFQPNPLYESVVDGVEKFKASNCEMIMAVGGGSAIDVAKCIKLYSNMNCNENFLQQRITANNILFIAMPTTSGTGSEATRYAVIYYRGEKQSVSDYSCIPSVVLMDSSTIKTLPLYQKKSTMMDAFCHAIESFWSVNSTEESKQFSRKAIGLILENKNKYLENDEDANKNMLLASYYAGKAINITQTTAGHAMCYKLTSLYGIAHGHAAALCDTKLWPFMVKNIKKCIDSRGQEYLMKTFDELADVFGCSTVLDAIDYFESFFKSLSLEVPTATEEEFNHLIKSVNTVRLKNNPVELSEEDIDMLYHEILNR